MLPTSAASPVDRSGMIRSSERYYHFAIYKGIRKLVDAQVLVSTMFNLWCSIPFLKLLLLDIHVNYPYVPYCQNRRFVHHKHAHRCKSNGRPRQAIKKEVHLKKRIIQKKGRSLVVLQVAKFRLIMISCNCAVCVEFHWKICYRNSLNEKSNQHFHLYIS